MGGCGIVVAVGRPSVKPPLPLGLPAASPLQSPPVCLFLRRPAPPPPLRLPLLPCASRRPPPPSSAHHTLPSPPHPDHDSLPTPPPPLPSPLHSSTLPAPSLSHARLHRLSYLSSTLVSSFGIRSLAAASVSYSFLWQMQGSSGVPWVEMFGTFFLAVGAAVSMEFWARWAHRVIWHASLWSMHESHHRTREGLFEVNDVFAIIHAIPAIILTGFGSLHRGLLPGLCFGAGLGITVYGIAYMLVHDGLVHQRFPVGPIADVPYFQRVAAAHQLHHADKFNGVPYGLFLGPMEVEDIGGITELDKVLQKRTKKRNEIQ